MLRVYLDQNKWIDLMHALEGDERAERFQDATIMVTPAADAGYASFPLSSGHVFETWKARRADPPLAPRVPQLMGTR